MTREKTLRPALQRALRALEDKQAADIALLDMGEAASFTDYFLLSTGNSAPHVRALADGVEEQLAARGRRPASVEGYRQAEWVLVDYGDFIVHVFNERARAFYDLERLWRRAARVPVPAATPRRTGT